MKHATNKPQQLCLQTVVSRAFRMMFCNNDLSCLMRIVHWHKLFTAIKQMTVHGNWKNKMKIIEWEYIKIKQL